MPKPISRAFMLGRNRISFFRTLLLVIGGVAACARYTAPALVAIRVVGDTAVLKSNPQGASFQAQAVVHNLGVRTIYVVGCGPSAEREINGEWTSVFSVACIGGPTLVAAPGDSAVIPVTLYGYTGGSLPRLDPRATPGRYRLVFS